MDKELENALEDIMNAVGKGVVAGAKGIGKGIKNLKTKKERITLMCCIVLSVLIHFLARKYIFAMDAPIWVRYLLYIMLMTAPLIYLYYLGIKENTVESEKDKYYKLFEEIGFKGKDGKYPYFIKVVEVEKKRLFTFKSNISLDDWKANKSKLETALNVNILAFEQKDDKKIVQLITVPADFKIPEMIRWNDEFISDKDGVIVLGESALETISFDLNKVPHVLIAGETGSGKSVLLRTCLWEMICKRAKVFMIDFKGGVEFGLDYEKFGEVITDRKRALKVLTMLCKENEKRLHLFRSMRVKNLAEFNKKTGKNLCRIAVFCDEIAEMLDKTGIAKEEKQLYEAIEAKLATLARLSRATGINLFLGVQRPDAKILPGQIKNNIPVRVSGRFADKTASEIVLGTTDATNLPIIKGRFLFKVGNEVIQFQSYYFDDDTMLHDVEVEQGGTLIEFEPPEQSNIDIESVAIFGQKKEKETVSQELESEGLDLNFDYSDVLNNGPEPDYDDEEDCYE